MCAMALPVKPIAPMGRSYGRRHVMEPGVGRMTPTYERRIAVPRLPSGRTQPRYMPEVQKDITQLPARPSAIAQPSAPSPGTTHRIASSVTTWSVTPDYSHHPAL